MTDEELIGRLRENALWVTTHDAADRIEALVKKRDDAVIKRAAWELEVKTQKARAERLEAALQAAVKWADGYRWAAPWVDNAHTALRGADNDRT